MTSRTMYLHRESNSDLIFRRDLFYPLNYRGVFRKIVFLFCLCSPVVIAKPYVVCVSSAKVTLFFEYDKRKDVLL